MYLIINTETGKFLTFRKSWAPYSKTPRVWGRRSDLAASIYHAIGGSSHYADKYAYCFVREIDAATGMILHSDPLPDFIDMLKAERAIRQEKEKLRYERRREAFLSAELARVRARADEIASVLHAS